MGKIPYQSEEMLAVRDDDVFEYDWEDLDNLNVVLAVSGSLASVTKVAQLLWEDKTVALRSFRNVRTKQPFDRFGCPWPLVPHEGGYAWRST